MAILSEVKVENYTPYEKEMVLTRTITLEKDAFPVPSTANDPNTTPISVSSSDVERGYVQWETMGDLYPPTVNSPLGSYKYLRVHWDMYIPAGTNDAELTLNHPTRPGPYEYYIEKKFIFRDVAPASVPSFTLTPLTLSALGGLGNKPICFQLSGHGYVNQFSLVSGLYGQDKQTDFPDGSAITTPFREPIYNRFFGSVGSVTESPLTQGGACLKKEYTVYGRIMPDLDVSTAAFNPATGDTSGPDAPTFWYNLNYELHHNKNIIPFVFEWGVGMATYDNGTWNPEGKDIDYQDNRSGHQSNNHGKRARSISWTEHLRLNTTSEYKVPNVFSSTDDITFSIVGPDVASPTSGVEVCAVYSDVFNTLNRTIFNWFDKSNRTAEEIELYGINCLPYTSHWVLRGEILLNENYVPSVTLTSRQANSQQSAKLEEIQAIDQNFASRELLGPFKYAYPEPPAQLLESEGYVDKTQAGAYILHSYWDGEPFDVSCYRLPFDVTTEPVSPYYQEPPLFRENKKLLKDLHDPWAQSPIGLAARPGIQGGQPGFNIIGMAGLNARTGNADMRFYQKATDLEWNRAFVEAERDGRILDFDGEQWKQKRFLENPGNINNLNLANYIRLNVDPLSTDWIIENIESRDFAGAKEYIDDTNVIGFDGLNPTWGGSDNYGWGRGQVSPNYTGRTEIGSFAMVNVVGNVAGSSSNRRFDPANIKVGYPISKFQTGWGYPGYGYYYNNKKSSYVASHTACSHQILYALVSGDKVALKYVDYYINAFSNILYDAEPARVLFYGGGAAPDSYRYNNVGRQEGRPYNALLMGLCTTRNSVLREKTLYKLSRRFWNLYVATNFEDYPQGVPGKPWRTIRYPGWAGGFQRTLVDGIPQDTFLSQESSLFGNNYWSYYGAAGDPYTWRYLPSKLEISAVNPNVDRERIISWDAFSVQQQQTQIYTPEYIMLEESRTGGPYRISCDESPLAALNPTTETITRRKSRLWTTEAFQNGLRYPYFYPVVELFNTYAQIFANRSGSIPFVTKHNNYLSLSDEFADTYTEFKNLLVRFCRSAIRNLLLKAASNSPLAPNKQACAYFQSPCSFSRFMEDYTDTDRTFTISENSLNIVPKCGITSLGTVYWQRLFENARFGPFFKAVNGLWTLGNASFGTNSWAFTVFPLAWDILYNYGNGQYDTELERAREYIEDFIGTIPYDEDLAEQYVNLRNDLYPYFWGTVGFPSPGIESKDFEGKLGSQEALTWWAAVTDNLWKDRDLDTISFTCDFEGESEFDTTLSAAGGLVVIDAPVADVSGESLMEGNFQVITPVFASVLVDAHDGMALPVSGGSSSDTEVIVYIVPNFEGGFETSLDGLAVTGSTALSWEGEFDSYLSLVSALSLNIDFDTSSGFEVERFNKSTSISEFSSHGEFDPELVELSIFISIPSHEFFGETEFDTSANVVFYLGTSYISELDPSGKLNLGNQLTASGFIGESLPISEFSDVNPIYEFLGESFPEAYISFYSAEGSFFNSGSSLDSNFIVSAGIDGDLQSTINSIRGSQTDLSRLSRFDFERKLFKEISQRSKGDAKISEIFRETLEYLINSFASIIYINDQNEIQPVKCWHANAERAVAKLKKESNIILPVISIYKEKNEIDVLRRRSASLIVQEKWWDTQKQRAVRVVGLAPVPVKISYKISVWAKYQEDIDQISEQIHRMFNPDMEVYTKYNSTTKAFLVEEEDSSELNIGDGADRLLKRIFSISVESYVPNPRFMITNTGRIEELNTEICIPI